MDVQADKIIARYQRMVSDLTFNLAVAETLLEQYKEREANDPPATPPTPEATPELA